MSGALYIFAGCALITASAVLLRMLSSAAISGQLSALFVNPFALPSQGKRFLLFGLLVTVAFIALITGRSLE
jgi:hypothetical protein